MAEETILRRELPHSLTLTRNAKGEYQWEIKTYFEVTDGAPVNDIQRIDADLRDRFLPKGE